MCVYTIYLLVGSKKLNTFYICTKKKKNVKSKNYSLLLRYVHKTVDDCERPPGKFPVVFEG